MLSDTLLYTSQNTTFDLSVCGAVFFLIFLAEIGDKGQLVCMTLAARHRAFPVMMGWFLRI